MDRLEVEDGDVLSVRGALLSAFDGVRADRGEEGRKGLRGDVLSELGRLIRRLSDAAFSSDDFGVFDVEDLEVEHGLLTDQADLADE